MQNGKTVQKNQRAAINLNCPMIYKRWKQLVNADTIGDNEQTLLTQHVQAFQAHTNTRARRAFWSQSSTFVCKAKPNATDENEKEEEEQVAKNKKRNMKSVTV